MSTTEKLRFSCPRCGGELFDILHSGSIDGVSTGQIRCNAGLHGSGTTFCGFNAPLDAGVYRMFWVVVTRPAYPTDVTPKELVTAAYGDSRQFDETTLQKIMELISP